MRSDLDQLAGVLATWTPHKSNGGYAMVRKGDGAVLHLDPEVHDRSAVMSVLARAESSNMDVDAVAAEILRLSLSNLVKPAAG